MGFRSRGREERLDSPGFLVFSVIVLLLLPQAGLFNRPGLSTAEAPVYQFALPQTSNPSSCLREIDLALRTASLSPDSASQMLSVAESSAAFNDFSMTDNPVFLAGPNATLDYAIEYQTSSDCSSLSITGYAFNFISAGAQLSVTVDPIDSVKSSMVVPAVTWVAGNQSSVNWFGYDFWEGGTYNNPTNLYWEIINNFRMPTITYPSSCSGCPSTLDVGMFSGLMDTAHHYIAQAGFGATITSGGILTKWLWYEFAPASPHNCNSISPATGDNLFAESQSDAENGGHAYVYNENMWDATLGKGCSYFGYNWSSGLNTNSYFAAMTGEIHYSYIPQYSQTQMVGTLYDNSGGPSGHTITYPWNNGWWESWYISNGGHKATESIVNQYSAFKLNFK